MGTTPGSAGEGTIDELLRALLTIKAPGNGHNELRNRLQSLETKLADDKLHLAVLGQMKRGKSSFINALLGAEILPTGVLPVTAIITEIRYGPKPEAEIVYSGGDFREKITPEHLSTYITEAGNPGNRKQVERVEVAYPSPLLANGIILIDTPGIGSTHLHNTETTEQYLESVDGAIVVLSVDPPITEAESDFLKRMRGDIPKLFFILNKTDLVSENDASAIEQFLKVELDRLQFASPEIFPFSARYALKAKICPDSTPDGYGFSTFEQRLQEFVVQEKRQALIGSVGLDLLQIAHALRFAAAIGARAGTMSPQDLFDKQRTLERLLHQSKTEVHEMAVLLRERANELVALVEQDLKSHIERGAPKVQQHLKRFESEHPRESGRVLGSLLEDFLMSQLETVFEKWRMQEDDRLQDQLDSLSERFVAQANIILEKLREGAGHLFDLPVEHLAISCSLRPESRLSYKIEPIFYSLDSFLLALPLFLLRPIVLRRLHRQVPLLLDMNAGRIRYDYIERLQVSITRFEKGLQSQIALVGESLEAVLQTGPNESGSHLDSLHTCELVIEGCLRL
jgi:ribosome biogenesis GTPase A